MSTKDREKIKNKYSGLCAYSGTPLEDDWQIDHVKPIIRDKDLGIVRFPDDTHENLVPVQKIINHYKHSLSLEEFRNWLLGGLHLRLAKLPKNPRTEKSLNRIRYLRKVAGYFGITEEKKFNGTFFFEEKKFTEK